MARRRWVVYYDDGSTFSWEDGRPDQAPPFGVLAVICDPDVWRCGDLVGLVDHLANHPGMEHCVRFGRLVANHTHDRVLGAARVDTACGLGRYVLEGGDYYWWVSDGHL